MAGLLERARDAAPVFVGELLGAFSPTEDVTSAPSALVEPLSGTQIEILNHLDRGLTNREIADRLAITVGTTKWHLNQIFGKLHVRNRVEAIAKARELRLL